MARFRHIVDVHDAAGGIVVTRRTVAAKRVLDDKHPPVVSLPDGGLTRGNEGDWLVVEDGVAHYVTDRDFREHYEPIAGDTESLALWGARV